MKSILYRSGYKYQLMSDCVVKTDIYPPEPVVTDYANVYKDGTLLVKKGYAWDGPSGPAIDTKNFLRGSLVHDACYQLLREGLLDPDYRDEADRLLRRICIEDGMTRVRALWVYLGVRWCAGPCADPSHCKPVQEAP